MEEVKKPINSECYIPWSEPFWIHKIRSIPIICIIFKFLLWFDMKKLNYKWDKSHARMPELHTTVNTAMDTRDVSFQSAPTQTAQHDNDERVTWYNFARRLFRLLILSALIWKIASSYNASDSYVEAGNSRFEFRSRHPAILNEVLQCTPRAPQANTVSLQQIRLANFLFP
jgi:hypothetical protein